MSDRDKLQKTILKEYPRMSREDSFSFQCHSGLECFNKCCQDVNIFLTPYDIIRLKNRLGISSTQFLENYTILPIEENLRHPIVMLKMSDESLKCPFVSETGCTVYTDRPWSCRMYPVGVASPAETQENEEFFFLLKEQVCKGFVEDKEWSVLKWMDDQGVAEYTELGEMFKEISLHEHFIKGKHIEPVKLEMFYMVCYDIDRFKSFVFESSFLKRFEVENDRQQKMRDSEVELLKFGFSWLRFALFGENTMNVKEQFVKQAN